MRYYPAGFQGERATTHSMGRAQLQKMGQVRECTLHGASQDSDPVDAMVSTQ